jgi:hypothetical protein
MREPRQQRGGVTHELLRPVGAQLALEAVDLDVLERLTTIRNRRRSDSPSPSARAPAEVRTRDAAPASSRSAITFLIVAGESSRPDCPRQHARSDWLTSTTKRSTSV